MAVGINVEDEQVSIVARPHLDLGAVAGEEAPVVADPDLDGRIDAGGAPHGGRRGMGGRAEQIEWKEQGRDHGASRNCCSNVETPTGHRVQDPDGASFPQLRALCHRVLTCFLNT